MINNFAKYIIEQNINRKDKLAFSDINGTLTYGELEQRIYGYSHFLKKMGVEPENKVLIHMDDSYDWMVAFLSIIAIGAVPLSANMFLNEKNVKDLFEYTNSKLIIKEIPTKFTEFNYEFYNWHPDEFAYFMFTSGSTANQLGVMHRHDTLKKIVDIFSKQAFVIDENSRILSPPKLSFGYGLVNAIYSLANGATSYFLKGPPSPSKIFDCFKENNITHFFAVPTMLNSLIKHKNKCEVFTPKIVFYAGETLPFSVYQKFKENFNTILLESYATSEVSSPICIQTPKDNNGFNSGKPLDGIECSLRDKNGNEVLEGEIGEMWVKHPCAGLGYYKDSKKSQYTFVGEWIRTGDSMMKQSDGNYKYISRNNDIIKVNGMFVSPTDIESVILTVDGVEDAAVVGKENEDGFYEIHAFVITNKNIDLRTELSNKLDKNKMPKYFHIVEDFPRSINLKKKRSVLRENLAVS